MRRPVPDGLNAPEEGTSEVLTSFESSNRKQINQTDPNCAMMHSIQGSHTSYNVQSVVEDEHGLIVQAQATVDTNDILQFARQIDQANEVLETPCKVACADAGYSDTAAMEKTDSFMLRRKDGVQAETSILATCFNIARMITILSVGNLIEKFKGLNPVIVGC